MSTLKQIAWIWTKYLCSLQALSHQPITRHHEVTSMLHYGAVLKVDDRLSRIETTLASLTSMLQTLTSSQKVSWQVSIELKVCFVTSCVYSVEPTHVMIRNLQRSLRESYSLIRQLRSLVIIFGSLFLYVPTICLKLSIADSPPMTGKDT